MLASPKWNACHLFVEQVSISPKPKGGNHATVIVATECVWVTGFESRPCFFKQAPTEIMIKNASTAIFLNPQGEIFRFERQGGSPMSCIDTSLVWTQMITSWA